MCYVSLVNGILFKLGLKNLRLLFVQILYVDKVIVWTATRVIPVSYVSLALDLSSADCQNFKNVCVGFPTVISKI